MAIQAYGFIGILPHNGIVPERAHNFHHLVQRLRFIAVVIALFAVSLLFALNNLSAQTISAPQRTSFGTITCPTSVLSTTIVIQNTGATTLILSGAAISPPNTDFTILAPLNVSSLLPLFVIPTTTLGVVVAYNPQRIGAQNAALVLASNSITTTTGIVSLVLTAQRDSSGFQLSTTSIIRNNIPANMPTLASVTVRNTGSVPLSFPVPQFSGAFALDSLIPASIPPQTEGRMVVRFFGAPAGVTTATTFSLADGCGRITELRAFAAVQAPPSITSFSPALGTVGTRITITGVNLSGATAVFVGGVPAQSFTVDSPTQITATIGQGASGPIFISVGGGAAISSQEFRFLPQPSVLFFTPQSGGTGTAVTIIGTHFENVTQVRFGDVLSPAFAINSPTQITALVGSGQTGLVSVSTALGSTSSTQQFAFIPSPQILFITPQIGPGGTVVTIIGNNLAGTRSVSFGGVPAQSFTQISPTQVNAVISSEGASGIITLTTAGGTATSGQVFTFTAPPSISFVSPTIGVQGTIVNIIGANFNNVIGVSFGGVPAQNFVVSSPTQIIATVGAGGASGSIVVSTQSGSTTASQQFVFASPPSISGFTPESGIAGTLVSIFGTAFANVSAVNFGGIPARSFTVLSPMHITAVLGDQGATGNISVLTSNGIGVSQSVFTFIPRSSVSAQAHGNPPAESSRTLHDLSCTPNPTSDGSTLHFTLAEASLVQIELSSLLGERLGNIKEEVMPRGKHSVEVQTHSLAQGVYACRIRAGASMRTLFLHIVR